MATNEDLSEEIAQLVRRADQDPRTHTFARLADLYRKTGEVDRALEVIEGGLKHHPHYLNARIVHARVLSDLGRLPEARDAFERVLQIDSENLVAKAALAELGVELPPPVVTSPPPVGLAGSEGGAGWLARLDAELQETLEGNGDGPPGPEEPAVPDPDPGDDDSADAELETATLAALYVRQGLFDRAIAVYERLLARDPYNARLASALEDARRRTDPAAAAAAPTPLSFPIPDPPVRAVQPPQDRRRSEVEPSKDPVGPNEEAPPSSMRDLLERILDGEAEGQSPETPGRWPVWLVELGRDAG